MKMDLTGKGSRLSILDVSDNERISYVRRIERHAYMDYGGST